MEKKNEWVVKAPFYAPADISHLSVKQLNDLKFKIKKSLSDETYPMYEAKSVYDYRDLTEEEEIETAKKSNTIIAMLTESQYPLENENVGTILKEYIIKLYIVDNDLLHGLFRDKIKEFYRLASEAKRLSKIVIVDNIFTGVAIYPEVDDLAILTFNYQGLMDSELLKDPKWVKNKLFIFNHIRYEHLVLLLRCNGVILSGGSHNRRHIVSPLEIRFFVNLIKLIDIINNIFVININLFELSTLNYHHKSFKVKDFSYKNKLADFLEICNSLYDITNWKSKDTMRTYKNVFKNLFFFSMLVHVYNHGVVIKPQPVCVDFFKSLLEVIEKRIKFLIANSKDKKSDRVIMGPNYTQKRGVHTHVDVIDKSSKPTLPVVTTNVFPFIGKKVKLSKAMLSYFNYLGKMLGEVTDPVKAQIEVEREWLDKYMECNLRDTEKFILSHSDTLQPLHFAKRTLDNILKNKKRSKFLRSYEHLSDVLDFRRGFIICYIIAIDCITKKFGFTYAISRIGATILIDAYNVKVRKFIKSLKKDNPSITPEEINKIRTEEQLISYDTFTQKYGITDQDILRIGDFFLTVFTAEPYNVFETEFNPIKGLVESDTKKLVFNKVHFNNVKENLVISPLSFPMLCQPKEWSDTQFGGYLRNTENRISVINLGGSVKHLTENLSVMYSAINIMSKTKFEINKLLLDYIDSGKAKFLFEDINPNDIYPYLVYIQAKIMSNYKLPFYIPLKGDFRGRIYTDSYYINFQGGDFSSAIIQFYEGEPLTDVGLEYLYIYGANLFNENNLSRSNYKDRINWTIENKERILAMDPSFISRANEKFRFTAFCLVMRELEKDSSYPVKLPVFFDATCSGLQHLAAITRDQELASKVNIVKQNDVEKVSDLYESLSHPINHEIRKLGLENKKYSNLAIVNLDRDILKRPIMTKTYNVSRWGIYEQLASKFSTIGDYQSKIFTNVPSIIKGQTTVVTDVELIKISEIIYNIIFKEYPLIESFYKYIKTITNVMNKAEIGMVWSTPSGLSITQYYKKVCRTSVLVPLSFKKKVVFREYTDNLDKVKQVNAIVPNIIHSLDASHMMNVIIKYNEIVGKPLITVHDCFGSHPNYINKLSEVVKDEFVKIYSDEEFVNTIHKSAITHLTNNKFLVRYDEKSELFKVAIDNQTYIIPNPPLRGKFDINQVRESVYIIN